MYHSSKFCCPVAADSEEDTIPCALYFQSKGFMVGIRKPGLISLKSAVIITPRTCSKLLKASHGNSLWLKPVFRIVWVAGTHFRITPLNSSRYWRLNWWEWRLGIIVGETVRTQGFHLSLNIIADKAPFFNRFEQFSVVKSALFPSEELSMCRSHIIVIIWIDVDMGTLKGFLHTSAYSLGVVFEWDWIK